MDSIFEDIKRDFNINSTKIDYVLRKLKEKKKKIKQEYITTEYLDTKSLFSIDDYIEKLEKIKKDKYKLYRAYSSIQDFVKQKGLLFGIITALALIAAIVSVIYQIIDHNKEYSEKVLDYEPSLYSTIIEETIDKYPNNQVIIANRHKDMFEYEKAIEYMEMGLQVEMEQKAPKQESIIYIKSSLGALYFLTGDFINALKMYTDIELLANKDKYLLGRTYFNKAQIYKQTNDDENANNYYIKAYELLPYSEYYISLMCQLVTFNLEYGTKEKAIFCLDEAKETYDTLSDISKTKYSVDISIAEAELLSHSMDFKESNELLKKTTVDNEDVLTKIKVLNLESYNNTGLRKLSEAEKQNEECLKLYELYFPNHEILLYVLNYNRIIIKLRQNKEREAKIITDELLNKFHEYEVYNTTSYVNIASLFVWSGIYDYAIYVMQDLDDKFLDTEMLIKKYAFLTQIYYNEQEFDKSIFYAQKAIDSGNDSGIETKFTYLCYLMLCNSYQDSGNIDSALSTCEEIISRYKLKYGNFVYKKIEEGTYKVNDALMDSEKVKVLGTSSINYMIQDIYKQSGLPDENFQTWWMNSYNKDSDKE